MPFDSVASKRAFKSEKLAKNAVFQEAGVAMVDVYCAHPGQQQPVHGHPNAAKCYAVIEGRARITIGDEIRDVGPGDLAYAPRGIPHGIEAIGPADLVALVFIAGSL
ncbi:MAG: cupin domain-containing protein [Myxococcota bacterium]